MSEVKYSLEKNIELNATSSFMLIILNFILVMTLVSYSDSRFAEIIKISFMPILTILYFFFFVSYKGKDRKIINKIFYVLLFLSFVSLIIIRYLIGLSNAFSNH